MDNITNLLELPFHFIRENLNGWVILVFICIMIYFIILRNYYFKKEKFYDQSMQLKNMKDIEEIEESDLIFGKNQSDNEDEELDEELGEDVVESEDNEDNEDNEEIENDNNSREIKKNIKQISNLDVKINSKANKKIEKHDLKTSTNIKTSTNKKKNKNRIGENNTVIIGKKVFEGLDNIEGFDGFISPTTTNYASIKTPSTTQIQSKSTITLSNPNTTKPQIINTTLFDNLNINTIQINLCKTNYTQVINTFITELSNLVKLKKNNEYLNTKKQFDVIIGRGIDNIINYISNTIKSPKIITRTSIKTDVINALSNNLEILINNKNNEITNQMNELAMMNSTTIDYNTMLNNINESRAQIDNYMEIDKLVVNNGDNLSNNSSEVNNVLNKSFVLPIYERNFDKINQLIKSDFNDNETNLANKYGRAYTDFLNEKKKDELDINPMRLASKIESGIVDMLTNLVNPSSKSEDSFTSKSLSLSNPIPEQQNMLVNNTNLNSNANIYKDRGNLGSYLIDKNTQKQVLEGFKNIEGFEGSPNNTSPNNTSPNTTSPNTTDPNTTSPNTTSPNTTDPNTTKYEYKKKKKKNNEDILSNIMSGDFIKYIMDIMNDYIGYLNGMYNNKFNSSDSKNKDKDNNKFNLEENMIPAGFLLFILSMLIYFIDTTS